MNDAATPLRYRLSLDLTGAARFAGEVEIDLAVEDGAEIALDALDLDIHSAAVDGVKRAWRLQEGRLNLGPAAGRITVAVRFEGRIDGGQRGLYRGPGYVAAQFQPAHAARVFPCLDDPRFRTPFELTVAVGAAEAVVSNAAVAAETVAEGRRTVRFAPTPPLPTYLLALAAGQFQVVEAEGPVPLRLFAVEPSDDAAFLLETAGKLLEACSDWLGVPYPFEKLDLVLLPGAAVAGMESTAAVLLRAEALAVGRVEQAALVAHELVHQWFGGLVTPASWRELWLNEGFATWLAPLMLERIGIATDWPAEVRAERQALQADLGRGRALISDGGGAVEALFDPITYRKGAGLLRMLQAWLGEPAMRAGLRAYLTDRALGVARSDDLWRALEAASGRPVARVMGPLTQQPGAPALTVRWCGDHVTLERVGGEASSLPLRVKVGLTSGGLETHDLLMEGPAAEVVAGGEVAWAFAAGDGLGWHRGLYLQSLPLSALNDAEAMVRLEDLWLALWAGEADLLQYLDLVREALAAGRAAASVRDHLDELADLLAGGARRPLFEAWVVEAGGRLAEAPVGSLDDPALDATARRMLAERLLGDGRTRASAWDWLKAHWDEDHIGLGGRGVLAGLAASADPQTLADVAGFFSSRPVAGWEAAIEAVLGQIRGRIAFRERQQSVMDAFLMRRAGGGKSVSPEAQALLAAMAAGFAGAIVQRAMTDRLGLPPPAWMHTAANLAGATGSVERALAQLQTGASVVTPAILALAERLVEDLEACAAQTERLLSRLDDGDRATGQAVIAAYARAETTLSRARQEAVVGAALAGDRATADRLRTEPPARVGPDQGEALDPAGPANRRQRLALKTRAAKAPALLREAAQSVRRSAAAFGASS